MAAMADRTPLVVVGDALLDRDLTGSADRLAPDAPVPVVSECAERVRPGGAALAAYLAARDGRAGHPDRGHGRRPGRSRPAGTARSLADPDPAAADRHGPGEDPRPRPGPSRRPPRPRRRPRSARPRTRPATRCGPPAPSWSPTTAGARRTPCATCSPPARRWSGTRTRAGSAGPRHPPGDARREGGPRASRRTGTTRAAACAPPRSTPPHSYRTGGRPRWR